MRADDLRALRDRVLAATGPDESIDAEIVAVLHDATVKRSPQTDDFGPRDRWQFWSRDGKHFLGGTRKFPVSHVTGSLDAAVALCERVLPDWSVDFLQDHRKRGGDCWTANVRNDRPPGTPPRRFGHGKTPALALVAACLSAKIAEMESDDAD
jgi:hypothetical protein